MKVVSLFILAILLFSCTGSKKKTFLDFELGMTPSEYYEHAIDLKSKGVIELKSVTNTSAMGLLFVATPIGTTEADLIIHKMEFKNSDGTEFNFVGEVRGDVFFDGRQFPMTSISYEFKHQNGTFLNKTDYEKLKKTLSEKYGTGFVEDYGLGDGNFYRAHWDKGNYVVEMVVDERPEYRRAKLFYYASGSLGNNIDRKIQEIKNKEENKVQNKF
ncbi:MAG: hypothetical protein ACJ75B_16980 [Flavisolibacter sp.]